MFNFFSKQTKDKTLCRHGHFILFNGGKLKMISRFLVVFLLVGVSYGLNNGLGRTPQMGKRNKNIRLSTNYFILGWNSWYNFWCHYDENRILQTVDIIVNSGLAAAGYEYGSF